jgi:hypothetical protein
VRGRKWRWLSPPISDWITEDLTYVTRGWHMDLFKP